MAPRLVIRPWDSWGLHREIHPRGDSPEGLPGIPPGFHPRGDPQEGSPGDSWGIPRGIPWSARGVSLGCPGARGIPRLITSTADGPASGDQALGFLGSPPGDPSQGGFPGGPSGDPPGVPSPRGSPGGFPGGFLGDTPGDPVVGPGDSLGCPGARGIPPGIHPRGIPGGVPRGIPGGYPGGSLFVGPGPWGSPQGPRGIHRGHPLVKWIVFRWSALVFTDRGVSWAVPPGVVPGGISPGDAPWGLGRFF